MSVNGVRVTLYSEALAVVGLVVLAWRSGPMAEGRFADALLSALVLGVLAFTLGLLCGRASTPRTVIVNALAVPVAYMVGFAVAGAGGGPWYGFLFDYAVTAALGLGVGFAGYGLGRESKTLSTH